MRPHLPSIQRLKSLVHKCKRLQYHRSYLETPWIPFLEEDTSALDTVFSEAFLFIGIFETKYKVQERKKNISKISFCIPLFKVPEVKGLDNMYCRYIVHCILNYTHKLYCCIIGNERALTPTNKFELSLNKRYCSSLMDYSYMSSTKVVFAIYYIH
jgi:hypothetical protein